MPSSASICMARGRADRAQARALVADHDALLGVALDVEVGHDVEQRLVVGTPLAQAHLLDHHGDRVRQLVAHALEGGLADEVGGQRLLGCVGEVAVGVERRPLGQQPDEQVGQQLDLVAGHRGDRARSRPTRCRSRRPAPAMSSRCWPSCSGVARSVLVATAMLDRAPHLGQLVDDEAVAGPDLLVGREAHRDHVDLRPRGAHQVVEPLAQQGAGPVQAGGVDEDQLRVGAVHDAAHHVAGGLRLGRRDDDLLAHQRVGQRRLARVGAADERREAAAVALGAS